MADSVRCTGPLAVHMDALHDWLGRSGCSPGRSVRCEHAFARFSSWMARRHFELADLDGDLIDEYVGQEQERTGSRTPAAFQYLPIARRYLVAAGVMRAAVLVSRRRDGVPRLLVGPLASMIPEMVTWLRLQGYAPGTVKAVAETAARLSAWMHASALAAEDVSHELLERFVVGQTTGPVRHPSSAHRVVTVRKYLTACGVLGEITAAPAQPATPVTTELDAWGGWLRVERGIGATAVADQQRWAEPFLTGLLTADGRIDWAQVDCAGVNRHVAARGSGYSLASRRHLVTAIKSLLRWAFATARTAYPMSGGVLRAPSSRTGLPRGLRPPQVQAITAAADSATATGARDLAVVMMFSRLGLRASEVAGLTLDDIDWAGGRLSVVGKSARKLTLPLPVDVGAALVDYLRVRHACGTDRAVFLRARPPWVRLSRQGISGIVARLAARAGLGTIHAHRLRHTVATQVLAAGGSLVEARELLGHSHTDVTINYARTDLASLRVLTLPWGRLPS
jgi:site-specific recombinase XerD